MNPLTGTCSSNLCKLATSFQALPRLTNRDKLMEMIDPALEGRYSNKDLIQVKHLGIIIICNFWFLGQYPAINICWFREISGGSYRGYVCTN